MANINNDLNEYNNNIDYSETPSNTIFIIPNRKKSRKSKKSKKYNKKSRKSRMGGFHHKKSRNKRR
tara:strand:- start:327 stop:524 length:198 start_codon:yes stop_codon:yes gene_type:complete